MVTVTATVTQAAMATCPAEFVQAPYDRGEFNRLVEGGAAALLPQGSAAPALDKRSAYLRAAGIDVNILAIYAHASGLWTDPNLTQGLVTDDKSCLTPTGQTLHAQLVGAWTAMGSKAENSPTPTTGTNSGIHNGVFVVAKEPGMRAGRTGVRITFSNGTSIFIDDLCLNPVYETPPPKSIIPGPTDEDECPDQPGRQAPGAACSKVGQIGSIDAGAHDPQGGKPDWTRNPLTTVEPSRPTVTNRATASPKPTKSATAPASTERPSSSPTTVVDEEPSHTSVPSPTSHW